MKVEQLALLNSGRRIAMDVAGAIAMVKGCEIGKLVLLSRAADDTASLTALHEVISGLLSDEHGGKADGLAWVIVRESVDPLRCVRCKGRGYVLDLSYGLEIDEYKRECDVCSGKGIIWESNRSRAKAAGYSETTFRRKNLSQVIESWVLELEKEAGEAAKKFARQ